LTEKLVCFSTAICLILNSLILTTYSNANVYGQSVIKGIIGQVVGDEKTQFYVRDVKATEESGNKVVNVSIIIKNKGHTEQEFSPSSLRLVDSQSREYDPDYNPIILGFSSIHFPRDDVISWSAKFKILPSNNFTKIYFFPDRYRTETRFTVDLTKSMNPPERAPISSWVLSSNKGVKVTNRQLELTINDEKYEGNNYIIDVTIKNVGNSPVPYDGGNLMVKDSTGSPYSRNFFYPLVSSLLSGDLTPGEMVRGDIAFNANNPSGNTMIIYAGLFGDPFLNTGSSSAAASRPPSGNSVEIVSGSSTPNNGDWFLPQTLSLAKGTTVTWTNEDATLHTVTSGSPESESASWGKAFDSSYIPAGKIFKHTFYEIGLFDYFCTLHPFMKGEIDVKQ